MYRLFMVPFIKKTLTFFLSPLLRKFEKLEKEIKELEIKLSQCKTNEKDFLAMRNRFSTIESKLLITDNKEKNVLE
jgi:hypothetical protein